jgi:hypothetical protein
MTQEEFARKKSEGLKEREGYYKKKILEDFENGLYGYFNTTRKSITVDNRMLLTPKQVLAVIKEKYPDLKLKARYPICHFGCTIDSEVKIIPKEKVKILFWEVWI